MAYRFSAKKLVLSCCVAAFALSACDAPTASAPPPNENLSSAEIDLRAHSAAMQKTITEAIALGGIAGLAARLLIPDNIVVSGNVGLAGFVVVGAGAGAAAGSYIAHLQAGFADEEARIAALRADLAANISETKATLQVMRAVLGNQMDELRRLQAAISAGTADAASLSREIAEAQANLVQMDTAADGATGRFNEFTDARISVGDGASGMDSELQQLSRQIALMREVAEDLAKNL